MRAPPVRVVLPGLRLVEAEEQGGLVHFLVDPRRRRVGRVLGGLHDVRDIIAGAAVTAQKAAYEARFARCRLTGQEGDVHHPHGSLDRQGEYPRRQVIAHHVMMFEFPAIQDIPYLSEEGTEVHLRTGVELGHVLHLGPLLAGVQREEQVAVHSAVHELPFDGCP